MQNISCSKLRDGTWGVRSATEVKAGQTVTVTKRDGGTKLETINKVVWSGNDIWIASLVASRAPSSLSAPRRGSSGGRRTGCSCGSREDASGVLIPSDRNCRQCEYDAE
jgi:hypothetical protein